MSKKILSLTLALCMVMAMLPATVFAGSTTECQGGEGCRHEAKIDTTHYDTLAEALEEAAPGNTVTLLKEVASADTLTVDEDIILDLAGYKLGFTAAGKYLNLTAASAEIKSTGSKGEIAGVNNALSVGANCQLTMDNCAVTAAPVSEASVTLVSLKGGSALTARGCDFSIAQSENSKGPHYGFSGLSSDITLKLTGCTVDVSNNPGVQSNAVSAYAGEFEFTDCAMTSNGSAVVWIRTQGSAVINGGTYTNEAGGNAVEAAWNSEKPMTIKGDVTVNGIVALAGTAENSTAQIVIENGKFDGLSAAVPTNFTITGGLYKADVSSFVTSGQCVANTDEATKADYPFMVTAPQGSSVAYTVNEGAYTYYDTLEDAVSANAGTVYLFGEATITDPAALSGAVISGSASGKITFAGTLEEVLSGALGTQFSAVNMTCGLSEFKNISAQGGKVTGGTFHVSGLEDYAGLLSEGYLFDGDKASSGTDTETSVNPVSSYGAKIGNLGYSTLNAAITAATYNDQGAQSVNDEIVMLADSDGPITVAMPNSCFTLDMNGHKITSAEDYGLGIVPSDLVQPNNADVIIRNGTINVTGEETIGVATNGTLSGINVELVDVNITSDGLGVYLPADGWYFIEGGSVKGGSTAVEIRAGMLELRGASLTGGNGEYSVSPNGSGSTTKNAALAVAQHTTKMPVQVNVEDCTLTATTALSQADPQNNAQTDVAVNVNGGEFNGDMINTSAGSASVQGTVITGSISNSGSGHMSIVGGTLSEMPAGNNLTIINTTVDGEKIEDIYGESVVAIYNGVSYPTLNEAITAASNMGGTVILVGSDSLRMPLDVNLVMYSGSALTVDNAMYLATGSLQIQSGASLVFSGEELVGGTGARLNLTSGSAEMQVVDMVPTVTLTRGSKANIPEGKEFFLMLGSDAETALKLRAVIADGAYLTVNGKLTVVNGSSLTVNGTLNVNGILRVNSQASLTSGESGKVNCPGAIALMKGGEETAYLGQTVITLEKGGCVYSQFALDDGAVVNFRQYTGTFTHEGIANSGEQSEPEFGYKYEYYVKSSGGSVSAYSVKIESAKHGTISADTDQASATTLVTLTVTPDDGYVLDDITVTDNSGKSIKVSGKSNGKYTFTMPEGSVTVKAKFTSDDEEEYSGPFDDVSENDWFYKAVMYAYDNDIMHGVDSDEFDPNGKLTRAMMAQILYNIEGGKTGYKQAFDDVKEGGWYYDAVNWAAEKGLVGGYGDGIFGPNDSITREQMAAIMYRYADLKGYDMKPSGDLDDFNDGGKTSDWAVESMEWAIGSGVINGKGSGILDPLGTATRAEVAQMFMNFLENIA